MDLDQEPPKPTPGNEGASTLDPLNRIEQLLSAGDGSDNQPEGDQPADTATTDDGAQDEVQQPQLTTSELAKLLGLDEDGLDLDEDGSLKFKTKIDGKEAAPKLADLIKSYQVQGHADNKSREVAEREKALDAKAKEAEQQFTQRLQYAEGLAKVAAQQLLDEFQSIDWKSLEQQDAGTAALYRQKFQERQAQLRGVFENIQREKAQGDEKANARERARLSELIPEWKDSAVANKERQELLTWLDSAGFQPDDLDMNKASTIALLRRAMLSDRVQKAKPEIENRVRTAPKLVKPGQPAQNGQAERLNSLRTAVKKSGGKGGTIEALLIASGKV